MSLELIDVKKAYRQPDGGTLQVLNVPSYKMNQGDQVALLGSSGGGKTTLLNAIAGITAIDSGKIVIQGHDIARMPEQVRDRFRALHIGYVFQTFNLLPAFTALENVLLGMSFRGKAADKKFAVDVLKRVGLGERLHYRPGQLSVGQQQRVAIARALANVPGLLLADEPTANIDPANQEKILDLILEACREYNVSLLLVTHSPEVSQRFERVEHLHEFNQLQVHMMDEKSDAEVGQ